MAYIYMIIKVLGFFIKRVKKIFRKISCDVKKIHISKNDDDAEKLFIVSLLIIGTTIKLLGFCELVRFILGFQKRFRTKQHNRKSDKFYIKVLQIFYFLFTKVCDKNLKR